MLDRIIHTGRIEDDAPPESGRRRLAVRREQHDLPLSALHQQRAIDSQFPLRIELHDRAGLYRQCHAGAHRHVAGHNIGIVRRPGRRLGYRAGDVDRCCRRGDGDCTRFRGVHPVAVAGGHLGQVVGPGLAGGAEALP